MVGTLKELINETYNVRTEKGIPKKFIEDIYVTFQTPDKCTTSVPKKDYLQVKNQIKDLSTNHKDYLNAHERKELNKLLNGEVWFNKFQMEKFHKKLSKRKKQNYPPIFKEEYEISEGITYNKHDIESLKSTNNFPTVNYIINTFSTNEKMMKDYSQYLSIPTKSEIQFFKDFAFSQYDKLLKENKMVKVIYNRYEELNRQYNQFQHLITKKSVEMKKGVPYN
ncbi:hypothetical protein ACFL1H_08230 [Nanoarchaeota archaeon]